MVNNSSNINKTTNDLSSEIIVHQKTTNYAEKSAGIRQTNIWNPLEFHNCYYCFFYFKRNKFASLGPDQKLKELQEENEKLRDRWFIF